MAVVVALLRHDVALLSESEPRSGEDLNQLEPPGRPTPDGDGRPRATEAFRDESNELLIGLAIHWRSLQLGEPRALRRLSEGTDPGVGPDLDLECDDCHDGAPASAPIARVFGGDALVAAPTDLET